MWVEAMSSVALVGPGDTRPWGQDVKAPACVPCWEPCDSCVSPHSRDSGLAFDGFKAECVRKSGSYKSSSVNIVCVSLPWQTHTPLSAGMHLDPVYYSWAHYCSTPVNPSCLLHPELSSMWWWHLSIVPKLLCRVVEQSENGLLQRAILPSTETVLCALFCQVSFPGRKFFLRLGQSFASAVLLALRRLPAREASVSKVRTAWLVADASITQARLCSTSLWILSNISMRKQDVSEIQVPVFLLVAVNKSWLSSELRRQLARAARCWATVVVYFTIQKFHEVFGAEAPTE